MEDEYWRGWAFAGIAEALAKAGDIQGALASVREVKDGSSRPWTFARIAEALAKDGDIQGALATARKATDEYRRAWAFANIAEALVTLANDAPADSKQQGTTSP